MSAFRARKDHANLERRGLATNEYATESTHNHSSGFPLASAELLVRLIDDEVQEHVVSAQDSRDLPSPLDVDEETTVHKF